MSVMEMPRATQTISLADYLQASADRFPQHTAIVDPDGSSLSYADLHERSSRVAGFLKSRGIVPGDRVGLLLPKSAATLTAIFGILKARAAYVPVDYSAPSARISSIFKDCQVKAIFTNAAGLNALQKEYGDSLPETVIVGDCDPANMDGSGTTWKIALDHPPLQELSATPKDLAYILYTSGSTGIPKGVMLSQENATSFVDWCSSVFSPTEHDRFSSHAPFHFDLSILDIYLSIKHGASLHIVSEDLGKSPKELAQFIADRKLTFWYSTPSILALLAQFGNLQNLDCSSLRMVFFAGEVFPVRHLRALTGFWPHPRYFNLYGPTETNVCTFAEVPASIPADRTEPYPIGPACSHCAPLVLDADKEVKNGEEGLLYISGPSVFQGYWNRPNENAAAFLERDGVRWYCTGDVVREDPQEGFIYVGRRDRMVKRRGYRIELDDIECALYRHPGIREAGVVASIASGDHTKIVAYLVAGSDPKPGVIEMKMFCGKNLPNYMNPDSFVFMDSLPRTSTNKVDYQMLLRKLHQDTKN